MIPSLPNSSSVPVLTLHGYRVRPREAGGRERRKASLEVETTKSSRERPPKLVSLWTSGPKCTRQRKAEKQIGCAASEDSLQVHNTALSCALGTGLIQQRGIRYKVTDLRTGIAGPQIPAPPSS